jgi:serine/threonine protein kinase
MNSAELLTLLRDTSVPVEDLATRLRDPSDEPDGDARKLVWAEAMQSLDATQVRRRRELRELLAGAAATVIRPRASEKTAKRPLPSSAASVEDPKSERQLVPGSRIERYILQTLLGRGGMGEVWKARDTILERTGDPNPYIAIKLLRDDFAADPDAVTALQREAGKAIQLAHPNIATVQIFGIDDGTDIAYIVMELLAGESLDRRIAEIGPRGMSRREALPIIRDLARGLAHAHSRDIVHCDFKPGNAFITTDGVAKVLDFGIARAAKNVSGDTFDAGVFKAVTLPYATIEMIEGTAPHPADDVYALGLVAYELLTGRHAFQYLSAEEAARKKLRPAPIKGLSRSEWRAIEKALAFRRDRRWQDAGAFLKALDGVSRLAVGLGAAVAAAVVIAGYAGYQKYVQSQPDVPLTELSQSKQADFHKAMRDGADLWKFVQQNPNDSLAVSVACEAVQSFAKAYQVHPRDPEAARALREGLDFLSGKMGHADPEIRHGVRTILQTIPEQSPALKAYGPLMVLIGDLN